MVPEEPEKEVMPFAKASTDENENDNEMVNLRRRREKRFEGLLQDAFDELDAPIDTRSS